MRGVLELAGGAERFLNSPCPTFRPGRFGFCFRFPLENGAALPFALRCNSSTCFRSCSFWRCNSRISPIRSSRLREFRSVINHLLPLLFNVGKLFLDSRTFLSLSARRRTSGCLSSGANQLRPLSRHCQSEIRSWYTELENYLQPGT